jgi:hypothetical protein
MGVAHQVMDGVNGFLINPNRVDTDARFARAVIGLIENRELRRELGQHAASYARSMSAPDVVLSRFEGIYERAIRRVHDEIKVPLIEQSKARQRYELGKALATWARYNYLLLAIGTASFRLGLGRKELDTSAVATAKPRESVLHDSGPFVRVEPNPVTTDAAE